MSEKSREDPDTPGAAPARPAEEQIEKLRSRSTLGLWPLTLFLALSTWARMEFRYIPDFPPSWYTWLGRPPPLLWIHTFLVIYLFSALILSLSRLAAGWHAFAGFRHLGYLAAFYAFYHLSGGLKDNFWAVFVGGVSVLGMEAYRQWAQCRQKIRELSPDGPSSNT